MPTITPEQAPEQLSLSPSIAEPEQQSLKFEADGDLEGHGPLINDVKNFYSHLKPAESRAERLAAGITVKGKAKHFVKKISAKGREKLTSEDSVETPVNEELEAYGEARDDYLSLYQSFIEADEKLTPEQRLLIKQEEEEESRRLRREVKLGFIDIEEELLDARMDLAKISAKLGHRVSREGKLNREFETALEKYMILFESKLRRDKKKQWEGYKTARKAQIARSRLEGLGSIDEQLAEGVSFEEAMKLEAAINEMKTSIEEKARLKKEHIWGDYKREHGLGEDSDEDFLGSIPDEDAAHLSEAFAKVDEEAEQQVKEQKKILQKRAEEERKEKIINDRTKLLDVSDEELAEELSEEEIFNFDKKLQEFSESEAITSARIVADVRTYLMQNYSHKGKFINWYNNKPRWAKVAVGAGVTTAIFSTPGVSLGVAAIAGGGTKALRGTLSNQADQLTVEKSEKKMRQYVREEKLKHGEAKHSEAQRRSIKGDVEYDIERNRRSVAWGAAGAAVGTTVSLVLNAADEMVDTGSAPTGESAGYEAGRGWSSNEHVTSPSDTTGETDLTDIDHNIEPEIVPNTDSNIEVENTTPDSEPQSDAEVGGDTADEIEFADDVESELAEIDPDDNPLVSSRALAPNSQEELLQRAIDIYADNNDLGIAEIEHPGAGSAYVTFDGVEWRTTMWPEINEILISLAETR